MFESARVRTSTTLDEPDAHVISRHLQVVIRGLLITSIMATVALMVFYRPAAHLAAIPIPVLYISLVVVNYYERRSRASRLRHVGQRGISQEEIDVDTEAAEVATVLKVMGTLALGTFIIAATLFDVADVVYVAGVALVLVIFLGLPYWPLIVAESGRDERDKAVREVRSTSEL